MLLLCILNGLLYGITPGLLSWTGVGAVLAGQFLAIAYVLLVLRA